MENTIKKKEFLFSLLLITIFFNTWFPKAGIKISGIPLTIGNVFFAITFVLWLAKSIKYRKIKIPKIGIAILISIAYFIIKFMVIGDFVESIGYIIPLIIYPFMFFLTYNLMDSKEKMLKVLKILVYGFLFLCIYSLIQFIVGIDKCAIPGLTVNYTDYTTLGKYWYMTKSNGTDLAMAKIVSTYQNGNIFGISLLLFYPIVYNYLKKQGKKKMLIVSLVLFLVVVFLTLSRACWLGIVLFLFFVVFFDKDKTKNNIMLKFVIIIFAAMSLFLVFNYMPSVVNRLFNTKASDWISMSGRTEGLITVLKTVSESNNILAWIIGPKGIIEYSGLAYEMFPLSLFAQCGIIGLTVMYYIFFKFIGLMKNKNYIQKAIRVSIIIWLFVGIIECGYWLPPAALNIFVIIALGCANNNIEEV